MAIKQEPFGLHQSRQVTAYTLVNGNGYRARLISFGARLVEMHAPDKNGKIADVVLGFDSLESYLITDTYFGATCGRYGNRIRKGRFELDGQLFQVGCNDASNHLHGGINGFDKYVWDVSLNEVENSVTFTHISVNGDEGFPGELLLKVKYKLTEDNRLLITLSGITDSTTILNMVHHSYWNLAGHDSGTVFNQMLTIEADYYTPVCDQLLATGEVLSVAGTPFDFRSAKLIGQDIGKVANGGGIDQMRGAEVGGGYDHNWVLRGANSALHPVATLWDPMSGRGIRLRSTEPGVQVYSGGYLSEAVVGKGRNPYCAYAGVTFETQKFPDSPNLSHFPSSRLESGETYCHEMEIQFFAWDI